MEFLIEFLIEVFGEIIINVIGFLISSFFDTVHSNSKIRKTIKNIIAFVFFSASIVVLSLSLIHHKAILSIVTIAYLLLMMFTYLFRYINRNIWLNNKARIVISWIQRIFHYSFPVLLIVFGNKTLIDYSAYLSLLIGCIIALVVFVFMDIYRIYRYVKYKEQHSDDSF